eukprot:5343276-Pleurochrysis_carterae.AAC.1
MQLAARPASAKITLTVIGLGGTSHFTLAIGNNSRSRLALPRRQNSNAEGDTSTVHRYGRGATSVLR